jgi:hypothetical protein
MAKEIHMRSTACALGVVATLTALALAAACSPESTDGDADGDGDSDGDGGITCGETGMPDEDGDGIASVHEGSGSVDTDRDGIADSSDTDSDGDGIDDAVEAGPEGRSCADPPEDADGDGIPNFQDLDSDGNGIRDADEGGPEADVDDDGVGDWRDRDDDGDGIDDTIEVGADGTDPADADGDGIPDYHDTDSDNDGIPDQQEGPGDMDQDGLQNFRDTEADGDGISDAEEGTGDCDGDGLGNWLDRDSDNDGVLDAIEREMRSDPCLPDTDGDGLTDLVERAIGTDPNDATSGIGEDEFMMILPYMDEDGPQTRELVFETNIKQADVYFLLDTTGSMWGEQEQLRTTMSTFIVPEVAARIRDVEFGVGRHDDVPISPYGSGADVAYEHVHDISGDIASVQAAIDGMGSGGGDDGQESHVLALYSTATGEGIDWASVEPSPGCLEGRFGYPCFRPYSLPIILLFTDMPFHNGPPDGTSYPYAGYEEPNWLDAISVLNDIGAKVLGIDSLGSMDDTYEHLEATAIATGAVRDDGTPLVWNINSDGTGLDMAVVDAIEDLSTQVARDVTTTVEEAPIVDDGIDAADFITSIVPVSANPDAGVESFDETTFYGVQAGTLLTFGVTFFNDFVPHTYEPQVFTARIIVLGDNTVRLDDRRVIILIPPSDIPIG